jgi:hypothetical protein
MLQWWMDPFLIDVRSVHIALFRLRRSTFVDYFEKRTNGAKDFRRAFEVPPTRQQIETAMDEIEAFLSSAR